MPGVFITSANLAETVKSGCTYWHAAVYLDRADLVVL